MFLWANRIAWLGGAVLFLWRPLSAKGKKSDPLRPRRLCGEIGVPASQLPSLLASKRATGANGRLQNKLVPRAIPEKDESQYFMNVPLQP